MPDIFLSYAHVDKHWVDTFAPLLEQRVNQYAGRPNPDRIWKDNRLTGNTAFSPEIHAQLAEARCLLACLSPGYLASEWCLRELAEFTTQAGENSGRLFYLELNPISLESKPSSLTRLLGYRFWRQDTLSKRTYPLNPSDPDYETHLIDLAKDIANSLGNAKKTPTAGKMEDISSSSPDKGRPGGVYSLIQQRKITALQSRWNILHDKLTRLEAQRDLETRIEEQMRMDKIIAETTATLQQVETELANYP